MALRHLFRLFAIVIIVVVATVSWTFLAEVIRYRTTAASGKLDGAVESLWGGPQSQRQPEVHLRWKMPGEAAPSADAKVQPPERVPANVPPGTVRRGAVHRRNVPPSRSRVAVDLDLDYRRKGLLWYSTYRAGVEASYTVRNDQEREVQAEFRFFLPAEGGVYDNFQLFVNGEEMEILSTAPEGAAPSVSAATLLPAGEEAVFEVRYRTQGLDTWRYTFCGASQIRDFRLVVDTDFDEVDFPASAMSPTRKTHTDEGWELTWEFTNLVGGRDIAVAMPRRLNPGPLAARISQFAPVSLIFFLGVLYFLYLLRGIPLHPVHYVFLAASFFSFHLLFAHLVDHLDLMLSFAVASAVSVLLVVAYLRVVVSPRFAFFQAGGLQMLYLVLFSFAHFFEGWTGLTVTVGAVVTLFVVMQMTARVDWEEVFPEPAGWKKVPPPAVGREG